MSAWAAVAALGPYTYDPYGNCFSGASACSAGVPYRFTGRRLDPETGLLYYRARMYWPGGGRFLQTDPVGYGPDINWYTYVANDPTDETDPTGEAAQTCTQRPDGQITCSGDPETVVVIGQRPPHHEHWTAKVTLAAAVALGARVVAADPEKRSAVVVGGAIVIGGAILAGGIYLWNKEHGESEETSGVDIDNPDSVRGADPDKVAQAAKDKGYIESPARDPAGRRFTSPNGSDQIRIMSGKPTRSDPTKRGPYAVISKGGKVTVVPLKGNSMQ